MASKKGSKALVDTKKASELNMAVLKRIDPETEEILASSGQVCLYKMSVDDQQWQRKNIEGSMFLIKRRSTPRFKMIVLNKLSTDNYTETVHGGLELELNPPYLMYTHGDDEIHGVWFYDASDLETFGRILKKIVDQLPRPDPSAAGGAADDTALQLTSPAPTATAAAAAPPPQLPAAASAASEAAGGGGRGGDDFWDRAVHVSEETLSAQRLVPNESLVLRDTASSQPAGGGGVAEAPRPSAGLQMLLKAAHQNFQDQRQVGGTSSAGPAAPTAVRTSGAAAAASGGGGGAEGAAGGTQLLTPSFFAKQAKQAAAAAQQQQQAGAAAPLAANHGGGAGGSSASLQQMLSSAARKAGAPPQPPAVAAAAAAAGGFGLPGSMPLPPAPPPQPQQLSQGHAQGQHVRERLRGALSNLIANDAFVDMVASELRAAGLLH